ncbi:hypothetical protein [Streptomyces sp. KS_5]|uniref:hypothetical protein n=1 Tax=Streptomyces sp. KS_5 TaxID=1881018 RepID=UPI00089BDA8B|nr:hypothetical protein [Streptomyces sp. KS_5]SEE35420.1 hypothetical protein SAMN05428938_7969 [Streptomyces sp. KS_5]
MSELLYLAQEAHGGLERWRSLTQLRFAASVGGSLPWPREGFLARTGVTLDTRSQRASLEPFGSPAHRGVYARDRVEIFDEDGELRAERDEPRRHVFGTRWDELSSAYFAGYTLWNSLTVPFLFSWTGFEVTEIAPWQERGEIWRRLQLRFPPYIGTHSPVQTCYFDSEDYLLRRHDYSADVIGQVPTAQYTANYETFDGFRFPTRTRVALRNPDNTSQQGPVIVSLDIDSVTAS